MSEYDPTWNVEHRLAPLKQWLVEVAGEAPAPDEVPTYEGPEVHSATSLPISVMLTAEQLRYDREEQGIDLWDRVLQVAYVLGMASGERHALQDDLRWCSAELLMEALEQSLEQRRERLGVLEHGARAGDA